SGQGDVPQRSAIVAVHELPGSDEAIDPVETLSRGDALPALIHRHGSCGLGAAAIAVGGRTHEIVRIAGTQQAHAGREVHIRDRSDAEWHTMWLDPQRPISSSHEK